MTYSTTPHSDRIATQHPVTRLHPLSTGSKRDAKAVKGKTKKGAGKVKHKGKKAKNAAKH